MWPRVTMTTYACGGRVVRSKPRWNVVDNDFGRVGKPLGVGELLAIVDDVHAEADLVSQSREVEADMPGADDVELGRRLDRLDVHVHLAAADEPGFLREVVRKLVVHELRASVGNRLASLPERVVLVAAAADGADARPSANTSILAPMRCGVEPVVATIVTSAAGSPRSSASATAANTSWFISAIIRGMPGAV